MHNLCVFEEKLFEMFFNQMADIIAQRKIHLRKEDPFTLEMQSRRLEFSSRSYQSFMILSSWRWWRRPGTMVLLKDLDKFKHLGVIIIIFIAFLLNVNKTTGFKHRTSKGRPLIIQNYFYFCKLIFAENVISIIYQDVSKNFHLLIFQLLLVLSIFNIVKFKELLTIRIIVSRPKHSFFFFKTDNSSSAF